MAVSLAVSTQYTNMTDTARRHRFALMHSIARQNRVSKKKLAGLVNIWETSSLALHRTACLWEWAAMSIDSWTPCSYMPLLCTLLFLIRCWDTINWVKSNSIIHLINQSINQSIKTHFYSAICRNESEAHVATRTRLSVQIVRFLKYD